MEEIDQELPGYSFKIPAKEIVKTPPPLLPDNLKEIISRNPQDNIVLQLRLASVTGTA